MLRNSDIEQAARHLVARRGEVAEGRAQKRANDFAHEGNTDAADIWWAIAARIRAIRATKAITRTPKSKKERLRFTVIDGGRP